MESEDRQPWSVSAARLAVFVGLSAGFVEVVVLAVTKYAGLAVPEGRLALGVVGQRHGYLWLSPHVVWMAPLAYTLLMLAVVGGTSALFHLLPRLRSARTRLTALLFVALTSLIWIYPRLYAIAGVVLAAGIAVQVGRVLDRWGSWAETVRRGTPVLAGLTAFLAVGMLAWGPLREHRRLADLPPSAQGAPNVVLIILDTVRAASLSLYGYGRETTPNLDARSREGVVFERAYATSPWTLPSHVSAFTGRWPYEFTANWFVPFQGEHPTLAEVLQSRGYATAGFVANTVYAAWESGLNRGFLHYEDYVLGPGELLLSCGLGRKLAHTPWVRRIFGFYDILDRKDAQEVTDSFLRWHSRSRTRPFFVFLNYLDAHEPYLPPRELADRFGPQDARHPELHTYQIRRAIRLGRQDMPPAELQAEHDAYDATIAYIDEQLERLFDTLDARGDLANTIVVVTGDHGEQFGEHGLHLHGNSLYDTVIHVPLAIWFGDRIPQGRRIRAPVSLRQLPATLASLATGTSAPFPGVSLSRHWQSEELPGDDGTAPERLGGPDPTAERLEAEFTDIRGAPIVKSVISDRFRYIWSEAGSQELYDLVEDPDEERNLVAEPAYQDTVQMMRGLMAPHVRNDSVLWRRLP